MKLDAPHCPLQLEQVGALDLLWLDTPILQCLPLAGMVEHCHQCGQVCLVDGAVHEPKRFAEGMRTVVAGKVDLLAPLLRGDREWL